MLGANKTYQAVFEVESDGFAVVKRKGNPLRERALVHRDLGKVGAVDPVNLINLVGRLVSTGRRLNNYPIIGLSESSILLGRVCSEFYGLGPFIFSTRYPAAGMISFAEPHSHAPNQFLNLSGIEDCRGLYIMEDEITTGNTAMNLIGALGANLPQLHSVEILALKVLCSSQRLTEMVRCAEQIGINLKIRYLYQEASVHDEPLVDWGIQPLAVPENLPVPISDLERGRGRIEPFNPLQVRARYSQWRKFLAQAKIPPAVTVIGASEAIDLSFEISQLLAMEGHASSFRHLTISPWELPGWHFPSANARTLHLYRPPKDGGAYILVYDHLFQTQPIQELAERLQAIGGQVLIISDIEGDIRLE